MLEGKKLDRVLYSAGVLGRKAARDATLRAKIGCEDGGPCDAAIRHSGVMDFDVEPHHLAQIDAEYLDALEAVMVASVIQSD